MVLLDGKYNNKNQAIVCGDAFFNSFLLFYKT